MLIPALLAMLLCAPAHAQTGEVTDSGTFVSDAAGRVVRLEGRDGVVVHYLYDTADSTETSGVSVQPNDEVTLTVRFDRRGGVAVAGLPALSTFVDHEGRTTAVHADRKLVALLDYTPSGFFGAVTLPARLMWKVSAPDASHHPRQSVENAAGKIIASYVITDLEGVPRGAWYDAAASDLGVRLDSLTYESSPTGALTTARDGKGRLAFYVVHAYGCDVGFSPDGTPRFYDLTLSVFDGTIAPGGDLVISPAWDAQHSAVPDHLVLTASGAAGLYVEHVAKKAIVAAWTDGAGRVCVTESEAD